MEDVETEREYDRWYYSVAETKGLTKIAVDEKKKDWTNLSCIGAMYIELQIGEKTTSQWHYLYIGTKYKSK